MIKIKGRNIDKDLHLHRNISILKSISIVKRNKDKIKKDLRVERK